MIIDKYTSIKEIVLNVYRDTGMDDEVNLEDMAYWTYDALEGLEFPLMYIPKALGWQGQEDLAFENYRAPLPDDFHKLISILVDGRPATPATYNQHLLFGNNCCGQNNYGNLPMDLFYDNFGNVFSPQIDNVSNNIATTYEPITFTISKSNVTFNVKEGKVCYTYLEFPVDEDGLPLVPDINAVRQAVKSYLIERLDYKNFRAGRISEALYKDSKRERNWYMAAAVAALKTPDVNQMESIKNMHMKMAIRKDEFQTNFRNLSKQGNRGRY